MAGVHVIATLKQCALHLDVWNGGLPATPLCSPQAVCPAASCPDCRIARRFKSHRLQALLTLQDLYVGLSPYTAPGVFSLLAATELVDGVHYPVGGFQKVDIGQLLPACCCLDSSRSRRCFCLPAGTQTLHLRAMYPVRPALVKMGLSLCRCAMGSRQLLKPVAYTL